MGRRTTALFMLVSMISAGALFAGQVSAKDAITSDATIKGAATRTTQAAASSPGVASPSCCMDAAVVTFQNYTPWKVQCFVNGTFVGLIYPGQTLSSYTGAGWNRPTAQAVFVDGSSLRWDLGAVFYVPGGSYAFPMYP